MVVWRYTVQTWTLSKIKKFKLNRSLFLPQLLCARLELPFAFVSHCPAPSTIDFIVSYQKIDAQLYRCLPSKQRSRPIGLFRVNSTYVGASCVRPDENKHFLLLFLKSQLFQYFPLLLLRKYNMERIYFTLR